jgi:hypothetical protein
MSKMIWTFKWSQEQVACIRDCLEHVRSRNEYAIADRGMQPIDKLAHRRCADQIRRILEDIDSITGGDDRQ